MTFGLSERGRGWVRRGPSAFLLLEVLQALQAMVSEETDLDVVKRGLHGLRAPVTGWISPCSIPFKPVSQP